MRTQTSFCSFSFVSKLVFKNQKNSLLGNILPMFGSSSPFLFTQLMVASPALLTMVSAMQPETSATEAVAWPLIWPLPKYYVNGTGTRTFTQLVVQPPTGTEGWMRDVIAALDRFNATAFPFAPDPADGHSTTALDVRFEIKDTTVSTTKQFGVDESYALSVPESGQVVIQSQTIFGFYYGLETLSQLIQYDGAAGSYTIKGTPWNIDDVPRFPHRGNSIDTSRHYMPVPTLKRVIDGLAYTKMNVFHWHIVDWQAFPFVSKAFPGLGPKTAWDPRLVYSHAMVKEVVEYARQCGVRVMVEMDTPGHNLAICKALPEICTPGPNTCHTLDPTKDVTYDVVIKLWEELTGLFPDNWMHWAGDECGTDCWENTKSIRDFVQSNNVSGGVAGLEAYYFERLSKMADKVFPTKKRVFWQDGEMTGDVINRGPSGLLPHLNPSNSIIHIWDRITKDSYTGWANSGFDLLWSPDWPNPDSVYEDQNIPWTAFYDAEPCQQLNITLNATQCSKFLGGESAEWSEHIDANRLLSYVFPRAAAYAERLWTPQDVTTAGGSSAAEKRLRWFRCLLNERGIDAYAPSVSPDAALPFRPMSCYDQE